MFKKYFGVYQKHQSSEHGLTSLHPIHKSVSFPVQFIFTVTGCEECHGNNPTRTLSGREGGGEGH